MDKIKITLVSLEQPCSACLIIEGHIKEMLSRLEKRMKNICVEHIVLENLRNVHSIEGLEIEQFPALIINGEQITAGSLPQLDALLMMINNYSKY